MTQPNSSPRPSFQFSLRTAFVLLLIAAVGISLWVLEQGHRKPPSARGERGSTRAQSETSWASWKSGRRYMLDFLLGAVPETGIPASGSGCGISPGEQLLTIALRRNESSDGGM
jgi:hypothetical protein